MNKKSDMNEFKQLEDLLINVDVDSNKYEEIILNRLKYKMQTGTIKSNYVEKDVLYMKKKFFKPATVAALALSTFILGGSAAYASGNLNSIIAHFQIGNAKIEQYATNNETEENSLTLQEDTSSNENSLALQEDNLSEENSLTLEEVKKVAKGNIKFPNYLPQGYTFESATASFEGAGVNVVYGNTLGDTIDILASTTKEATCGVATTEKISEISIDGNKVILSGNCALWESNSVTYQLYWNYKNSNDVNLTSDDIKQVTQIIESIK